MRDKAIEEVADLSAIERVAVKIEAVAGGITSSSSSWQYRNGLLRAAQIVRAALDKTPEPEWEYGWAGEDDASPWRLDQEFESVQEAEAFASSADRAWVRRDGGHIVRRRIAGPWLPVPGREGETR